MDLAERVYRDVEPVKRYSLKNQMERSSLSVPPNIAEGQERDAPRDFMRFLRLAKGSSGELRTRAILSKRLGVLPPDSAEQIIGETREISAMLQGLVRSVERNLADQS